MDIGGTLTNIALGGASGAAILKLVDWFLSDQQRKQLADISVRFWNWVDEARRTRLIIHFRSGKPQLILAICAQVVAVIFGVRTISMDAPGFEWIDTELLIRLVAAVFGSLLGTWADTRWLLPSILNWLANARNQFFYLLRCYVVVAGTGALGAALTGALSLLGRNVDVDGLEIWLIPEWQRLGAIMASMGVLTIVLTFLLILVLSFLAGVGMLVVRALFSLIEFIARRIAESPKGPLLSGSALIGGVAALAKAFQ